MNKLVFGLILVTLLMTKTAISSECGSTDENIVLISPQWPLHTDGNYGLVKIEATVNAAGDLETQNVLSSEPSREFIRPARKAVEKWHFSTSTKARRCFNVVVEFKLSDL